MTTFSQMPPCVTVYSTVHSITLLYYLIIIKEKKEGEGNKKMGDLQYGSILGCRIIHNYQSVICKYDSFIGMPVYPPLITTVFPQPTWPARQSLREAAHHRRRVILSTFSTSPYALQIKMFASEKKSVCTALVLRHTL